MTADKTNLPDHALSFCGPGTGFDWQSDAAIVENLKGLKYAAVYRFTTPNAIIATTDMDCDIDGPGGSLATDPCWQSATSLRTAAGTSVDSREFPGIVVPPALISLGVQIGDFGFAIWRGAVMAFQVYDSGPTKLIGEGSIFLLRALSLVAPNQTDRHAANNAGLAQDIVSIFFPGSGPKHAISRRLIERCAKQYLPAGSPLLSVAAS
jgi:hypothetical protein